MYSAANCAFDGCVFRRREAIHQRMMTSAAPMTAWKKGLFIQSGSTPGQTESQRKSSTPGGV